MNLSHLSGMTEEESLDLWLDHILEIAYPSGYNTGEEEQMKEDRASELLAACLDFLEKSTSTDLSETVCYDGVERDGHCLIADIRACLEDCQYGWISVGERLPIADENVLTFCVSEEETFKYCCVAYYAPERGIKLHAPVYEWELDLADFCEEDDSWYIREGWYEVVYNHDEIGCLPIRDKVTHWIPLPEQPRKSA